MVMLHVSLYFFAVNFFFLFYVQVITLCAVVISSLSVLRHSIKNTKLYVNPAPRTSSRARATYNICYGKLLSVQSFWMTHNTLALVSFVRLVLCTVAKRAPHEGRVGF